MKSGEFYSDLPFMRKVWKTVWRRKRATTKELKYVPWVISNGLDPIFRWSGPYLPDQYAEIIKKLEYMNRYRRKRLFKKRDTPTRRKIFLKDHGYTNEHI